MACPPAWRGKLLLKLVLFARRDFLTRRLMVGRANAGSTGEGSLTLEVETFRWRGGSRYDLSAIAGTNLDKGISLDALAKMEREERSLSSNKKHINGL
jgi:hypothetical protein